MDQCSEERLGHVRVYALSSRRSSLVKDHSSTTHTHTSQNSNTEFLTNSLVRRQLHARQRVAQRSSRFLLRVQRRSSFCFFVVVVLVESRRSWAAATPPTLPLRAERRPSGIDPSFLQKYLERSRVSFVSPSWHTIERVFGESHTDRATTFEILNRDRHQKSRHSVARETTLLGTLQKQELTLNRCPVRLAGQAPSVAALEATASGRAFLSVY